TIGLQAGLIDASLFSVVILITLVTTLVTPLLLKLVYLARPQDVRVPLPEREALLVQEGTHVR
ncbi:MAG TPA: hypothetical protein VF844_04395, partial [Ktedonobacteraceae bacterium]